MARVWFRRGNVWFAEYDDVVKNNLIVEDHKFYLIVRVGNKKVKFVPIGWVFVNRYESEDGKYVILVDDDATQDF